MKPEELVKSLDFLVDAVIGWTDCLKDPSKVYRAILIESTGTDAIKRAIKIWITAFLLTLIFQGWAYQLYGISLSNIGFHLSSALFILTILVVFAFSFQLGYQLFNLKIPFVDTFVAYTVYISAISPISGLLLSPSLAQTLGIVKKLKSQNVDLTTAIQGFYSQIIIQQGLPVGIISTVSSILNTVIVFIQLTNLFDSLASHSKIDRLMVFNAGAFGLTVSVIPTMLLSLINLMTIYSVM